MSKTTFLSLIGGQLRPKEGVIKINGVDIYDLSDTQRRDLIGLQVQTATNLRGELRYNLLFGLPGNEEMDSFLEADPEALDYEQVLELIAEHRAKSVKEQIYTDEELIEILQKDGLWEIFVAKEGLETLISEGGLNLSGGQRQRLNFAGLHLWAKYFKPSVILIDEPTSSLDEVFEHAVTKMILELAKDSLTFVIAHRLKTLDKASGILDFSLNTDEKQMKFYTQKELANRSDYYQKLIKGEVELDG